MAKSPEPKAPIPASEAKPDSAPKPAAPVAAAAPASVVEATRVVAAETAGAVSKAVEAVAKPAPKSASAPTPAPKPVARKPIAVPRTKPVASSPKAATPAAKIKSSVKPAPSKPASIARGAKPQPPASPRFRGNPDMATKTFAPTYPSFMPTPENLQSAFGDFQARAKDTMEKGAKAVEDMGEFAKGNVEAVMTSGRIAAKGAETMGQGAAEYSKKSFEDAAAAFKSMVAAKSPTELFTLQSDYARKSFDAAVAEGSKLSETWLKLAGEIMQPLSTRVALAAEKIKSPLN